MPLALNSIRAALCWALSIYFFILLARIILSYVPRPPDGLRPLVTAVHVLTDPPMRLVRPLVPPLRVGGLALDLSPLIIFILIALAQNAIC